MTVTGWARHLARNVGGASLLTGLWLVGGCHTPSNAELLLSLRMPQGLLDGATRVVLDVYAADAAACDGNTGRATPQGEGTKDSYPLESTGCATGASWCKTITLDRDETTRIFSVTASADGKLLAQGCTKALVDQDPLDVRIDVKPPILDRCCGDGVLQVGEQCDSGVNTMTACNADTGGSTCGGVDADAVCSCDCVAEEILLSIPSDTGQVFLNNDPGTKGRLALAFSGQSGPISGALRGVFEDAAGSDSGELNVRLLQPSLHPYPLDENATGIAYWAAFQIPLPTCANPGGKLSPREQRQPAMARSSTNSTAVVYASNETGSLEAYAIYLSEQGEAGCSSGQVAVSKDVNASAAFPDVAAGPGDKLLIVWRDGTGIQGRIKNPDGTLFPADKTLELGTIAADGRPKVVGTSDGWLVAYAGARDGDSDGVYLARLDAMGVVNATDRVNAVTDGLQTHPDIARLPDGQTAVVWRQDGQIFLQRYDAKLERIVGDQDAAINPSQPAATDASRLDAGAPVIASGTSASPWFVAAWEAADGTIHARYIGATSGFGFNSVDGNNLDFVATHPSINTARRDPAIAISNTYVAIGWTDTSQDHPGVYVRRMPLPY